MEPRIQYAKTEDGVNIAFYTLGEGEPLVMMPMGPLSDIQLEWQVLGNRQLLGALSQTRTVVAYDGRGSGLSEGDVTALSLDVWVADLETVVGRLALDEFSLLAPALLGPAGIAYAVRNPSRVSRLVLWCTAPRGADFLGSPRNRALGGMMMADWDLYSETLAHLVYGWSAGEPARKFAARIRETYTAEKVRAGFRAAAEMDATEILPRVGCPTLVLHRRQLPFFEVDISRRLASRIPDARLALLEGDSLSPYLGDVDTVVAAIGDFLGPGRRATPSAAEAEPGGLRTILFTDVEASTSLTERLGDAGARSVLRTHERITREALGGYGGSEVKTMGDGFMASFSSATRALECAVALQRAFAEHNESAEEPIMIRIGLNAGEPIEEEQDLFGAAVIRAARIAAMAEGGEILVANVVRELAEGKGFLFSDRGDSPLRGFEDPVRLFEVSWRERE